MLRNALLGFTFLLASAGYLLWALGGDKRAWPMAIWGGVIFVLILLERWRYQHANEDISRDNSGEWQTTDEQFIDPETGKMTKVLYQPTTGERRYVAVDESQ